jgi:two-component system, chemotaxis family, response regulator Rcp1
MGSLCNILLVEDNDDDVELIQRALAGGTGRYKLSMARSGFHALDYLHQRGKFAEAPRPDVILLDINMPGMDGKQLLANLKQDPVLRFIPVVMLSSSTSSEDIRDCYARNANCYVVKPLDAPAFMEVVRRAVIFWSEVPRLP